MKQKTMQAAEAAMDAGDMPGKDFSVPHVM
jgi:hypothetical protein